MDRRRFLKTASIGSVALAAVPALEQALATVAEASGGADHVSWDIISVNIPITTLSPGGVAYASAAPNLKIKLTGSGTFVSPASGGTSDAVTGGGTWETWNGDVSTGSGTYQVTGLASWQFANMQAPGLIDHVGDVNQRANGNAVLRVRYSPDGSEGILGIGCHGPGAPSQGGGDTILEGVIATKGYFTYWNREAPPANGDKNRTLFHLLSAAGTKSSTPTELTGSATGALAGTTGGAFDFYQISKPTGAGMSLAFNYGPYDSGQAHAIGIAVYQNGSKLGSVTGQASGEGDATNTSAVSLWVTPSASGGPVLIQVFNYGNYIANYLLTAK